ncbi:MAG TPA: hypothetical protein VKS01_06880, partial [Bryobacteraceae bacterium]|nr:hypothetical protein [Bryobacteraceae bacterium]
MQPSEYYSQRLEFWRSTHVRADAQYHRLVRARLATGLIAVAVAALAFGALLISPWWLLAPLAIFIGLAVVHARVDRERSTAARAIAYHERSTARLENQWIGRGSPGDGFRNPKHVYADDLDLFGRGSLFELLSTARTQAGERTLAQWLLAPSEASAVLARQQAVAELRSRCDLREELTLIGDDVRAAVDAKTLG